MERLRFKDENNEVSKIHLKVLSEVLEKGSKKPVKDKAKYKRITVKLHLKGIEETEPVSHLKDTRPFYQRFNNEIIIGKQNYFNGSVAIVPEKYDGAICSNAIMSFKVKNIDTNYLFYQISRRDFLKKREMLANGTGQKELSEKDFLNFKVEVPSKLEQEKIGGFLSAFDRLIEKQREKVELLRKFGNGLIGSKYDHLSDTEKMSRDKMKLRQVVKINPKTMKLPDKFFYIDLESVEKGELVKISELFLNEAPSRAQRLLKKYDLLFQTVRSYLGNHLLFNDNENLDYVGSTGYAQLRVIDKVSYPSYIYFLFYSKDFKNKVHQLSTGSNYPAITSKSLGEIEVALPNYEYQKFLGDTLSSVFEMVLLEEKKLNHYIDMKNSYIQKLL